MSSKLVKNKKNKPKYGWIQSEIDALDKRERMEKKLAGYAVTMVNHVLEIGLWTLHDKFGFGQKRLNRVQDCVNAYLAAHYKGTLNIHELPFALQEMKVKVNVEEAAKKIPQRCRIKMAEMERVNNPNEFKLRLQVITEALGVAFSMMCTELVTREKMSSAKVHGFLEECTTLVNEYLDGGWISQEDIRQALKNETGVSVALM